MGNGHENFYDVIVIGAGLNGEWVAKGLSEGGLRVLILDAGPIMKEADFTRIPRDGVFHRAAFFLGGHRRIAAAAVLNSATHPFYVNERENPYTFPKQKPFRWFRGRQVGGRGHLWGRHALRYAPEDFQTRAEDGATWPIRYEDLDPYYGRVEEFMLLEGQKDHIEGLPDGCYVKPHELTPTEHRFREAVNRRWPEKNVIPARVLSYPYGPISPMLQSALNTKRVELRPMSVVESILTDPKGERAIGVSCIDRAERRRLLFHSDAVVCCASTIESIRILLNSAPGGLGNSSGLLGCYLMDHIMVWQMGATPESSNLAPNWFHLSSDAGVYIPRLRKREFTDSGFRGSYAIHGSLGRAGKLWTLAALGEMLARIENRVTLHPRIKDKWGIPVPHIECSFSENEHALLGDSIRTIEELVSSAGLSVSRKFLPLPIRILSSFVRRTGLISDMPVPGASIHESGGIRMGDSQQASLLNRHNQMWEVPNLFVVDSSCFPAISFQHPTLTTMALALRACDYILSPEFGASGARGRP